MGKIEVTKEKIARDLAHDVTLLFAGFFQEPTCEFYPSGPFVKKRRSIEIYVHGWLSLFWSTLFRDLSDTKVIRNLHQHLIFTPQVGWSRWLSAIGPFDKAFARSSKAAAVF